jgi:hypothetical protein
MAGSIRRIPRGDRLSWRVSDAATGQRLNAAAIAAMNAAMLTTTHVVFDAEGRGIAGSRYPACPHRGHGEEPSSSTRIDASSSFVSGPNQRHDEQLK